MCSYTRLLTVPRQRAGTCCAAPAGRHRGPDVWSVNLPPEKRGFLPDASMWLAAIPSDVASSRPDARPSRPCTLHCGAESRGAEVDADADHHHLLACSRKGLLPRRGFVVVGWAWVQVARDAVTAVAVAHNRAR